MGWALGDHHDQAGTDSLFIVPQLAWLERNGNPGRFAEPGHFRAFLDELLSTTLVDALGGPRRLTDVTTIVLVAHSAGYETAAAILERGQVSDLVGSVVLLDALYARSDVFESWLAQAPDRRRLVSVYTGTATTARRSRALAGALQERLETDRVAIDPEGPIGDAVRAHTVVVAQSPHGHGMIPARHMAEILAALGLRMR